MCAFSVLIFLIFGWNFAFAITIDSFVARPPIHIWGSTMTTPHGMSPDQIKSAYHLPSSGGSGTIAVIAAHDDPNIEADLAVFNSQFKLASCTTNNGCFEKHKMKKNVSANAGWSLETSLDVEWSHAVAPNAKILLVESGSATGKDLLAAVDYARSRSDVVAISMSWGGPEFKTETTLESHFISPYGAVFVASSGDDGAGVSWPAVSAHVISVGGTRLELSDSGIFEKEKAWSGSGGGASDYITEPAFQGQYSIPKSGGMRAVPDVSYNADPSSGFSIYNSYGPKKQQGWSVVGGTSAGAPQWAAIIALGHSANLDSIYKDKAGDSNLSYFRDIISGTNGECKYFCSARKRYDYVTGLGSPLTVNF